MTPQHWYVADSGPESAWPAPSSLCDDQGQRPSPMQAWGEAQRSPRLRTQTITEPRRGGPKNDAYLGPPFQGSLACVKPVPGAPLRCAPGLLMGGPLGLTLSSLCDEPTEGLSRLHFGQSERSDA